MPFVVGIALTSLKIGSPFFIEVLSSDDESFIHSLQEQIADPSNLTSTFEKIAIAVGGPFHAVSLSLPSFLAKEERDAIFKAAKAVPVFSKLLRTRNNINTVLNSKPWMQVDYKAQHELVLEIASDAATSRLITTDVEGNFREVVVEKEFFTKTTSSIELIAELVDPALRALEDMPPPPEPNYMILEDHSLKRVLILNSSPTFASSVINALKSKFRHLTPPVDIIVEDSRTTLARYAAAEALEVYLEGLSWEAGDFYVFNTTPLTVGIVKADGFVTTAIKRNRSFPITQTLRFTTSKDNQMTATIKVVAGIAPRAADDNTVIAELVLRGLDPRPKGVPRINVTISVEQLGRAQIEAEEEMTDSLTAKGSTEFVELENLLGDMTDEYVTANVENHRFLADGKAPRDQEAEDSEARWFGKDVLGDLPE